MFKNITSLKKQHAIVRNMLLFHLYIQTLIKFIHYIDYAVHLNLIFQNNEIINFIQHLKSIAFFKNTHIWFVLTIFLIRQQFQFL